MSSTRSRRSSPRPKETRWASPSSPLSPRRRSLSRREGRSQNPRRTNRDFWPSWGELGAPPLSSSELATPQVEDPHARRRFLLYFVIWYGCSDLGLLPHCGRSKKEQILGAGSPMVELQWGGGVERTTTEQRWSSESGLM